VKIGWVASEKGALYLIPESFTRAVNDYNRALGEPALSVRELGQALHQEGYFATTGRDRLARSFRAEGNVVKVWILNVDSIYPCLEEETGENP